MHVLQLFLIILLDDVDNFRTTLRESKYENITPLILYMKNVSNSIYSVFEILVMITDRQTGSAQKKRQNLLTHQKNLFS